eukprot:jgi/Tetstr1/423920/TSEL_014543.t1
MVAFSRTEAAAVAERRAFFVNVLAPVAVLASRRHQRRLASVLNLEHARVRLIERVLWPSGFKVVGRKANKKRRRMDWHDRWDMDDADWQRRYKISKDRFAEIVATVRDDVEACDKKQGGRGSGGVISAELRLSMALRYFAGGHYLDIADLHGVAPGAVHLSVALVIKALLKHYQDKWITIPLNDSDKLDAMAREFWELSGETMSGCIGCVDGIVLPIELPRYGDDAYKASGQIVTPLPGVNLSESEAAFNFYLSRCRITIERAFGVWKKRWGVFHRPSGMALSLFTKMVLATMIMHNMIIDDQNESDAITVGENMRRHQRFLDGSSSRFRGTAGEMSDEQPGDAPEVMFNDMT